MVTFSALTSGFSSISFIIRSLSSTVNALWKSSCEKYVCFSNSVQLILSLGSNFKQYYRTKDGEEDYGNIQNIC